MLTRLGKLGAALILALPLTLGLAGSASATAQPPYYFRFANNHSWCITDPGDSTANGVHALLEHCSTSTPGMQLHFVKYADNAWFIETDKGMCLEDPAHGTNGTPLDWWSCEAVTWMIWGWYTDVAGHNFWPDYATPGEAIGLLNAQPFANATIDAEVPAFPPAPRQLSEEWCVTDAIGTPLVCN